MQRALLVAIALLTPAAAQESSWLTDFEAAKATAKKEGKVILADFTGSDWCGWCIKLKEEVFDTAEFKEWAAKKVVLLELDFPRKTELAAELKAQNQGLAKQYGIQGYPTILFLDADGRELGRYGYDAGGPTPWIAKAETMMKPSPWLTDYKQALATAKKEKKKVVIANFTGSDWCGWCIKLKDEVFSKPEFLEWAEDNAVLLELDFPRNKQLPAELTKQNEKLRDEFGIEGYPTIVFLDTKGKKLGRSGYLEGGPAAWIAAAEKETGIKSKPRKKGKKKDKAAD